MVLKEETAIDFPTGLEGRELTDFAAILALDTELTGLVEVLTLDLTFDVRDEVFDVTGRLGTAFFSGGFATSTAILSFLATG